MKAPALVVPDASVAVKWFIREELADEARLLRAAFRGRLVAPILLLHECANAGWLNIGKGSVSSERADLMVASLPEIVALVPPDAELARRALFIAEELNHPAYDCFYLAFAEREGLWLVTADARLLGKVKGALWGDLTISLPDAAQAWGKRGGRRIRG